MTTEKTPVDLVREFIEAFDGSKDHDLCRKLIREEAQELREAAEHLLKEATDFAYVVGYAQACGLEIYKDVGILAEFLGVPKIVEAFPDDILMEAFLRVHESNMSKLGDDGKPVRREDGKILKSSNYKPPYLGDLV